jgi:hypothetical protein
MTRLPWWLPAVGVLAGFACSGCAPGPSPQVPAGAVAFREIQRDADVYRITLSWREDAPPDLEERLLKRCAQVALREGARYFYVVNADFDVRNEEYLKPGSRLTPVFRVPAPEPEPGGASPPRTSATVTIKLFGAGQEPEGYRLYDVERVLRQRLTGRFDTRVGPEEVRRSLPRRPFMQRQTGLFPPPFPVARLRRATVGLGAEGSA